MLHISRQPAGGFPEAIHERSDLGAARMRHQEPCDRQRGFFKILQLGPQRLTIFIQLLQRFVAVDEIAVRSNPKLHVLLAHEGKFFIVELEYLAGLLLSVEEVLHICLESPQLLHPGLKLCKTTRRGRLDYLSTSNNYPTSQAAYLYSYSGGGGCGSETNLFKSSCKAQDISMTTHKQRLLD
jgi:hypothetical protein